MLSELDTEIRSSRLEVKARDIILGVTSLEMVFKSMGHDTIT